MKRRGTRQCWLTLRICCFEKKGDLWVHQRRPVRMTPPPIILQWAPYKANLSLSLSLSLFNLSIAIFYKIAIAQSRLHLLFRWCLPWTRAQGQSSFVDSLSTGWWRPVPCSGVTAKVWYVWYVSSRHSFNEKKKKKQHISATVIV